MLSVIHNNTLYEYDRELSGWFQYDDNKDIWQITKIDPLTLSDIVITKKECCSICKWFDWHNDKCNKGVMTNFRGFHIDEPDTFCCSKYEDLL